jgi:MFS family permease
MVFIHLPWNLLLMLVPLMPNPLLATLVLFVRFSISQMDVPSRQSYTMAIVAPDERSAAAGVTGIARSIGAAIFPGFAGALLSSPTFFAAPFFIAGGLKVIYDLLLYRGLRVATAPKPKPALNPKSIDSKSSVRYPIELALVIRVTKRNINFKRGVSFLVVLAV